MYSEYEDLLDLVSESELLQLTDDAGTGTPDRNIAERAILDADGEIDAFCATRYDVPFTEPVPQIIRKISVDLALYHLYSRKPPVPDDRKARHERALDLLKMLKNGELSLGTALPSPDDDGGPEATPPKTERTFTREKLRFF